MLRSEKVRLVEEMTGSFGSTPHIFLTAFSGISSNQANELRAKVREAGGGYKVIKNRLAKRAAEGNGMAKLSDQLSGPVAVASHETDPVGLAKVLTEFAKGNPALEVFAAVLDGEAVIDAAGVKQLSSLPGLPELRAQLLALINTPATTLVRLLGTPGTQTARVIDAWRESQDGGDGGSE